MRKITEYEVYQATRSTFQTQKPTTAVGLSKLNENQYLQDKHAKKRTLILARCRLINQI